MGKFSATVSLNSPIQKVFDFLNDQRNFTDLNPHNFRDYRVVSSQSIGVGARSEFALKTGVFREPAHLEAITSESPSLLIHEGYLSDNPYRTTWKLSPVSPTQTELELTTEYEISGPVVLLSGRIQAAFERIYKRLLTDIVGKLNTVA